MIRRHLPTPIMHRAVCANGFVFLGGVVAADTSADISGQTVQVLAALEQHLAAAGADRDDIVSATIYMTDLALKNEMNAVWTRWFRAEQLPARATVGVASLGPGMLIEVSVIAAERKEPHN